MSVGLELEVSGRTTEEIPHLRAFHCPVSHLAIQGEEDCLVLEYLEDVSKALFEQLKHFFIIL